MEAIGELSDLPVYIDDKSCHGTSELRSKATRLALAKDLDLFVVDYLQLLAGESSSRRPKNRTQEITKISRDLKVIAGELHVPLIACCQLNRAIEGRLGHRPMLSDIRDSGSIDQDADQVMFIHREDRYYTEEEWDRHNPGEPYPRGIAEIILAKHRHGPIGSVRFRFRFRDQMVRFETIMQPSDDHVNGSVGSW